MDVPIECICPGTPHAGDVITLRERLDFRSGLVVRNEFVLINQLQGGGSVSEYMAAATEQYVIHGIEAWTLVDAKGEAVEVTHGAIREHLLPHFAEATKVADAADALYGEAVMTPLLQMASSSSDSTPTEAPTSPQSGGSPDQTPPPPSSPSSTTTIPTDDIERTSWRLAGVSSSSPIPRSEPSSEPMPELPSRPLVISSERG